MRLIMLMMLLSFPLVFAAGTSTGGTTDPAIPLTVDCETHEVVEDRILCRLDNEEESSIPEACRGLAEEDECVVKYDVVDECYELTGTIKDECFKQHADFEYVSVSDEAASGNIDGVKWYVSFLLYDLQEYIEHQHEEGLVTSEEAAGLIAQIVAIKQAVFTSSGDVQVMISDLKSSWEMIV